MSTTNFKGELDGKTQFGDLKTAEKSQIINLKSVYGLSNLRDFQEKAGSATITNDGGEYKLTTTANGTDSAILESAERGRYYAGQDALAGIGIRLNSTPTGGQSARWGYFDENNGFGFGRDATGIFVFDIMGGTETKVYQSSWNTDSLDGTGGSGLTLDLSDGVIFQINFSWYGYGTVSFEVVYFDPSANKQKIIMVHRLRKTGSVSIEDPNLPIRAEVNNGGTASAFDSLYVGGRQFSTVGKVNAVSRITSERNLELGSIATTFLPIVSLKRKTAFESVSVKISAVEVLTDFDAIIEVRLNPTLTGATYGTPTNHSASETALEADTSATAVSGGEVIFTHFVSSSGVGSNAQGSATIPLIAQDFVNTQPVTVCIRRITGTGGTASCIFRVNEEW